jgi:hypothetical protein
VAQNLVCMTTAYVNCTEFYCQEHIPHWSKITVAISLIYAGWAIGVRSMARAADFSSGLCVQTASGAHTGSCIMASGGPFLGVQRSRGVTLTTYPPPVPRSILSRSYNPSPPKRLHGVQRDSVTLLCVPTRNDVRGGHVHPAIVSNTQSASL